MPVLYDYTNAVLLVILGATSMTHDSSRQTPLTLAGNAPRVAPPAVFYAFSPTVVQGGAPGSNLTFSIENKPPWASFGRRHGTLYGVPHAKDAGTYADIRITVTDGTRVGHLQAFALVVPAAALRQ